MRFAERMGFLKTAASFDMLARGKALEAQGRSIVHLGIGEPDFDTPAFIRRAAADALEEIVADEYWPLPWYLRGISQVGYWTTPPTDCEGALVIASATQADVVRSRLTRPHRESMLGLRPGVLLVVFTPQP